MCHHPSRFLRLPWNGIFVFKHQIWRPLTGTLCCFTLCCSWQLLQQNPELLKVRYQEAPVTRGSTSPYFLGHWRSGSNWSYRVKGARANIKSKGQQTGRTEWKWLESSSSNPNGCHTSHCDICSLGQSWYFLSKFIHWFFNYLLDQVWCPQPQWGPLNVPLM